MSSSGTNQACAACKFQRRRCSADCPLARYFPAEQNQRFMNCKRLFGVSNMVRFLKEVEPNDRDDTMKSLMFEADARERDPVHGCVGIINRLKDQLAKLAEDLSATREQLSYFLEQQHAINVYQVQQQFQQAQGGVGGGGGGGGGGGVNLPSSTMVQSAASCATILPQIAYTHSIPIASLESASPPDYGAKQILEASRQDFSRSPYEHRMSEDLPLNSVQLVNHVPDHELKSAAALFSLTSQH